MDTSTESKSYEVVVGLDFSDLSRRALEEAIDIASRRPAAQLHVIAVAEQQGLLVRLPADGEVLEENVAREKTRAHVAKIIDEYQAAHGALSLHRVAVYVVTGDPSKLITDLARAVDASLIVVGTHGRKGVSRLMLGSVAANVVRDASCGVYVVRPADFVGGKKVPEIQPPLQPGEAHLKHFEHRRTFHYVDRNSQPPSSVMPAS
jgi:nucleotide-binding universal stress UspA family protein